MQVVSGAVGREKVHFEAPAAERLEVEMSRFLEWFNAPQIEAERKDYYQGLEAAQRGDVNITAWLEWFLGCVERAIEAAEQTLGAVLKKTALWQRINLRPVNERQRSVINRMMNGFEGFLSTSKYAKLAKCSADTALRDIAELLDRGIVVRNPGGSTFATGC